MSADASHDCPPNRILIANRGEIALRVARTVRDLGGTSILPYTPEDLMSPAAEFVDEAYALPEGSGYTDAAAILDLAHRTGAEAIHPGYGFLAEDADFAQAVGDAGITWVGPSPSAMRTLGDKLSARAAAVAAGVDPVPGITDSVTDPESVVAFAAVHGYPVALKRTDGGGGRGITVLEDDAAVRATPAFDSAAGVGTLILEKYVTAARHVETQCARDAHGAFAVVSTRDCTLQRRNQKLLEEAPAPYLPDAVQERLHEASRRLLEAVDYVGVATCEFLLTPAGELWFLEVNPRLQVEHCVSEEVTGVDLVETQLRIAAGGRLGPVPAPRGHSLELRITCEDPAQGLAPSTGTITRLRWPAGPGIRIDSGVVEGDTVTPAFDPMLAKIVVTGADRDQAIRRARRALRETVVEGVTVCTSLHAHVLGREEFTRPDADSRLSVTTRWLEDAVLPDLAAPAVGTGAAAGEPLPDSHRTRSTYVVEINGHRLQVTVPDGILGGHSRRLGGSYPGGSHLAQQPLRGRGSGRGRSAASGSAQGGDPGAIAAPMQAIVTRICVSPGQRVRAGDLLVVLESMKMENYVHAPADATVADIPVSAGRTVSAGEILVRMRDIRDDSQPQQEA
ncbi:acetyl-CoA/propionyl-CoA carboxylase, biotin carboxylase, biotin carboxyl carrier protein [Actinomyces ruminicola]|uniref:Acetyl-CoA/propionyl-CoA carboxylase, biotin carboxylase, biotin carboxyl carrier protein n=1 Tax=Actinomyces ruminicola TaxID=332524 RepID=A0A1H0CYY0_9ACTO|nr:biotin carboxylase N-terminal domain-containing protein [Actinomyces ruminicola]SDN63115.1 acetyl-CoA/propionyl-CoA carboxylase, biotin carboxylase, biotin carboxyl carrier protein [Actinomyces ruminicola]